ncbi:MAG: putative toxin-antitoxin system toxin component, PIN family [Candidatus Bathyarchaeota archaeon]|nr:putative toxin-antitoxin system toxin component, PIN family [Candidatus Bathyarchaeota archaeon]
MVRVVVDTNVLVSAFLNGGKSRELLAKLLEEHTVVLSASMLAELADVLSREKFGVKTETVNRFVSTLVQRATVVPLDSNIRVVMDDPDDDVVVNTAVSGKAEYIVSGDGHLLKIGVYKNIRLITVNECSLLLRKKKSRGIIRNKKC